MTTKDKELCPKPPKVFVRDATGLVRSFSWLDALIIGMGATGPNILGISSQVGWVIPTIAGADVVLSTLFGILFMIPLAVVYYIFSAQMPRSGGDYVWIGRSLNPIVGFVGGWAMWISFVTLFAAANVSTPAVVIPDFAFIWGRIWNNPGLVAWGQSIPTSSTNLFLGTMLDIVIGILLVTFGTEIYKRVVLVIGAITLIGTVIFIGAFATATPASFNSGLSAMTGGGVTVGGVVSQAQQAGMPFVPLNSAATFLSIPFGVLLLNGFNYSVYISGEVKNARRSMLWGTVIALAICGLLDMAGIYFIMQAQTYPFVQAAFSLYNAGKFAMGVSPWPLLFIPAVVSNPYLASFLALTVLVSPFWFSAAMALVTTRYVFAFSFDRLVPTAFADVNDRWHIPLKATALIFVLSAVLVYFAVYTTYIGQVLNVSAIWAFVWIIVGISATIFPFRRKDLAEHLPGGRWLLSVFGVLTIIVMAMTLYWTVTIPAIGPSTPSSTVFLLLIFGSAVVIFLARYFYFRRQGIDLIAGLKQIPPE